MNEKKLEDLIRKGVDERTPDPEALACLRIAANHGALKVNTDAERLGKLEEERDAARKDAEKIQGRSGTLQADPGQDDGLGRGANQAR